LISEKYSFTYNRLFKRPIAKLILTKNAVNWNTRNISVNPVHTQALIITMLAYERIDVWFKHEGDEQGGPSH